MFILSASKRIRDEPDIDERELRVYLFNDSTLKNSATALTDLPVIPLSWYGPSEDTYAEEEREPEERQRAKEERDGNASTRTHVHGPCNVEMSPLDVGTVLLVSGKTVDELFEEGGGDVGSSVLDTNLGRRSERGGACQERLERERRR